MIKRASASIDKWIDLSNDDNSTLINFKEFEKYEELKPMSKKARRILFNKITNVFFKIFLDQGEFNMKNLFTLRLAYRFYWKALDIKLKIAIIVNDISCRKGLNKLAPILKITNEKKLQDDIL